MTTRLSKLSDLASRWVENLVWVQTGYWQPDPVPPPPDEPDYPDDPIEEEPLPTYGTYVSYHSWPNVPSSFNYGLIPSGYVLRGGSILTGPYLSFPVYRIEYFSWYEPPY